MQYRKRPGIVEATQWFKNGDHPLDEFGASPTKGKDFEGKIVRYYRNPDLMDAKVECDYCKSIMHNHGWIDTVQGGHIVCPGDWIINETQKTKEGYYPCKADVFNDSYEELKKYEKLSDKYFKSDKKFKFDKEIHGWSRAK